MAADNQGGLGWQIESLPKAVQSALEFFACQEWLSDPSWYLAGGTALAAQFGHRASFDLDFFSRRKTFDPQKITARLSDARWKIDKSEEGSILGSFGQTKVSFLSYPHFIPEQKVKNYGRLNVLSAIDLAVMKITAISQRGRKRDFVDLYWCIHNVEPLPDLIQRLPRQYPEVAHNYHHILKGLVYFEDAEQDPMPELYFEASWPEIKSCFEGQVSQMVDRFL